MVGYLKKSHWGVADEEEVAKSRMAGELKKLGKVAEVSKGEKTSVGSYYFLQTVLLNRNLL